MPCNDTFWTPARWPVPATVKAGTTTRIPGCSLPPYNNFNLAMHVGDDPELVAQNRSRLRQDLNLPAEPVWLHQTHSGNAIQYQPGACNPRADAVYTTLPGVVCTVLTADCVPVLLCDTAGHEIAAVHAGWRGIKNGIVDNALKFFTCNPADIAAWIGPHISSQHYEVGDAVRQELKNISGQDNDQLFKRKSKGKWLADLGGLVSSQLAGAGINSIYRCEDCTYQDNNRYFSYRKEKKTGRMASLIWIEHGEME